MVEGALRVLLSARDPAAAQVAHNLCTEVASSSSIEVQLVASPPASNLLRAQGHSVTELQWPTDETKRAIERQVTGLLEQLSPQVIVAGASGPDAGIDEYLVKLAGQRPTYVVQDFWGDVNLVLGSTPD